MTESSDRWWVAEAIFHVVVAADGLETARTREDLLFLVRAIDQESAERKAVVLAQDKETTYDNKFGQPVKWKLIALVGVAEVLDDDLKDGTELRSKLTDP